MDLYFMRHGETLWNREGRIQGATDIDLTDFGRELAGITADGLAADGISFDRIYTSPLRRAVDTAHIIAEKALPAGVTAESFVVEPRLIEMNFGNYEGKILKEIRADDKNIDNCFRVPSLFVPDGKGESYNEVCARITDFIYDVIIPLEGKMSSVMIVCHGTVVRAFLAALRGLELDDFWKISQPNCSVNHARLEGGKFSMTEEKKLYYDKDLMKNRGIL